MEGHGSSKWSSKPRGLTLRSSGPPPAGRARLGEKHTPGPASRFRPLSSNVGAHETQMQVRKRSGNFRQGNGDFAAQGCEHLTAASTLMVNARFKALESQFLSVCPGVVRQTLVELHACLAQAARPLAGDSPIMVRPAGEPNAPLRCRAQANEPRSERPPPSSPRGVGALACVRDFGCRQSNHGASSASSKVRPNPSLERTSTGLAREPTQGIVPSRGPIRFRPAQLKR